MIQEYSLKANHNLRHPSLFLTIGKQAHSKFKMWHQKGKLGRQVVKADI